MDARPEISVIIPTYNRLGLLKQTLESVWKQTFCAYELIVIDDGSTDGTWEYLVSLIPSIKVLRQENGGSGAARNLGAKHAVGDYLAFLDSDDVWFPWTLATFAELIGKHGSPSILSAKVIEIVQEGDLDGVGAEPIRADVFPDYFASSLARYFVGSGMAVLGRDVFLASGGFVEERLNGEDHDLILRMGAAPGFVQVLAPTTLGWRRHSTSETSNYQHTLQGISRMIEQERCGVYPGGSIRARERQEIVTSHTRSTSLMCLRVNRFADAWRMYAATLGWNVRLGRWKYIALFPILALAATLHRKRIGDEASRHSVMNGSTV